ncbi:MAG: hypothetical protein H8E60_00140 [Candidatus Marinimicrobia bacterium]|nr:hypothetical protein [Candidatus Neomarinimicrobiota bacterium]
MKNTSQNAQITSKNAPLSDASCISDSMLEEEYVKRFTLPVGKQISCSNDVIRHLRPFFTDRFKEQFVVVFLNGCNKIISTEVLFEGSLTSSAVYTREVIRKIIELGSASLIIAHNHPSGNPNASKEDISITKKLMDACKTIDVTIHDHIIIAGLNVTSFTEQGLI